MTGTDSLTAFVRLTCTEAAYVAGGVDKGAQDALYTIGYILGIVAKFFVALFAFDLKKKA